MAAKSILEIEVNDTQFQKFLEDFKEFQGALGALPDDWKKLGVSIGGAAGAGVKALGGIAPELERATVGQQRLGRATHATASAMGTVAARAKEAAGYFASMAKMGALGAIGLGGAGLFGMDRLANAVFGQRRTALGLGVSTGEQAAFRTNFGQFVDPDNLLSNVANARNDLARQVDFRALGIGAGDEARMDNADLSAEVMRRARQMWRSGPQTKQYADAFRLTQFFSMEDLRRLGAMSDQDFGTASSGFGRDRAGMSVPDDVQRQWVQFSTQLRRAGIQIESTFVRNLAPLTPGLEHLSVGLTHTIEAFMGSKGIKTAIENLGAWIDSPQIKSAITNFGDWLGSPKFAQDMRTFANDIGIVAEKTVSALALLQKIPDHTTEAVEGGLLGWLLGGRAGAAIGAVGGWAGAEMKQWAKDFDKNHPWASRIDHALGFGTPDNEAMRKHFAMAGAKYGVPPELLWNVYGAESSFGFDTRTSAAGAIGPMQIMPDTARMLGIDPNDPQQAAMGAARYLGIMYSKYHDWRKAVAAYNMGPGNLDADIAAHGREWEKFLKPETQSELAKAFPGSGGGAAGGPSELTRVLDRLRRQMASRPTQVPVQVSISGDVAGRVAVLGAQVGHG